MTNKQIEYFIKCADEGTIPDDLNPIFIFGIIHTDLLVKILNKEIDPYGAALYELEKRGLDKNGKYVGFQTKTAPRKKPGKRNGRSV